MMKGTFVLFFMVTVGLKAQNPIGSNPTANAASLALNAELLIWYDREPRLRRAIKDFNEQYMHRGEFYASTVLDNGAVINDVDATIARADQLLIDNQNLTFFYVYKQRDNRLQLEQILEQLAHQRGDLGNMDPNTIYGERMVLNQDVEISMEAVNRKLDDIESKINNSRILARILGL